MEKKIGQIVYKNLGKDLITSSVRGRQRNSGKPFAQGDVEISFDEGETVFTAGTVAHGEIFVD